MFFFSLMINFNILSKSFVTFVVISLNRSIKDPAVFEILQYTSQDEDHLLIRGELL